MRRRVSIAVLVVAVGAALLLRHPSGSPPSDDSSAAIAPEAHEVVPIASEPTEDLQADAPASTESNDRQPAPYRRPGAVFLGPEGLRAEPRDEPWASATEARILGAMSSLKFGANVIVAECRTNQCRIEVLPQADLCPFEAAEFKKVEQLDQIRQLVQSAIEDDVRVGCPGPLDKSVILTVLRASKAPGEFPTSRRQGAFGTP